MSEKTEKAYDVLTLKLDKGGNKRYAVLSDEPCVTADWQSDEMWSNSNQRWEVRIWERIGSRGFVCCLDGSGQWSNRGDHGRYVGIGDTATKAFYDAWGDTHASLYYYDDESDTPNSLLGPCRDFDDERNPSPVE